jgi:hypothetical protein
MTNGTFDADGSGSGVFTLNSDTNGDAAIGTMAGGSITGEVTFERYFENTSNRWRNISFPVTSVTYAELGTSITLNANSLATYTESTLGNVDQGWNIISGGTLNSARGHTAWMYNIAPITISVRGPLLRGTPAQSGSPYNFGVTYTNDPAQPATEDGWNFVPNPFASPIDWNNSGWVKTNVNAAAAVWDIENAVYRYTNVDWDGVVAQGQAFWVQTNAANPTLTCTESAKETVVDPVFYREATAESRLMITLASDLYKDKAMIQFREGSTSEFDPEFDSYKMKNPIFNLSSFTESGERLAGNVMPRTACTSTVKLSITDIEAGSFTLTFEGIHSFDNLNSIVLTDQFTGQTQPIEEGSSYRFEITADAKSLDSERFQISFDFADQQSNPTVQKEERQLISSYDEGNQWYMNDEPIEGATGKYFTPSQRGAYHVVVKDGSCSLTSEKLVVNEGLARVFPNPVSTILKVDVQNLLEPGTTGGIFVRSSHGQAIVNESFTDKDAIKEISVVGFKPGAYLLTIVSPSGVVLEKSKVVIE